MNSKFKISIPKPCHENWNKMTPKEKGRFCSSCSKTVVDFTKKSTKEIQDYLVENKKQRVCGHFYKKQLDTIVIEIPQVTFQQQLSFQKLFILALFFVMGTTLFSCQYSDGKKQKIENVIIVDTLKKIDKKIDSLKTSIKQDTIIVSKKRVIPPPITITTGITICEVKPKEETNTFNLKNVEELEELGEVVDIIDEIEVIEGDIAYEENEEVIFGMIIQEFPRFKEAKNLTKKEAKKDFDKRIKKFVDENFDINTTINLGLKEGKHRIYTQLTIDNKGFVTVLKVRAPHPKLEKEVRKMFENLPQFIPGKQRNKAVKTSYTLPIVFVVE